jgi:hypothetical protein
MIDSYTTPHDKLSEGESERVGNVKNKIVFSLLVLSLIMLPTMTSLASATDYTKVGVKVGDTANYSYSNPQGNGTLQINVQQITGTNVTINIKKINSNGSSTPDNIVTGNLSAPTNKILLYLVASNLTQGDSVTPGHQLLTIDKTTTMKIQGINRTVIHVSYALVISDMDFGGYYFDAYWDKSTGLGIKSVITVSGFFATVGMPAGSYITNLTSTTAFGNKIDPIVVLLTAGVTVLLVAAAITVYALNRRKAARPK